MSTDFLIDHIKKIEPQQERFFGGPGKMLIPSVATVQAMVQKIPKGSIMTTNILRKTLANKFKVQGTCPVTLKKILQILGATKSNKVWRVTKQNGELLTVFPEGIQASLLLKEGLKLEDTGKNIGKNLRVANFKAHLYQPKN